MYDSLLLPVHDQGENSDRDTTTRTLSRHKVKTAVAILFVVVVALVGLSTTQTPKASSQKSTAAYLEAKTDLITEGQKVLTKYAIKGVDSGAYITHSSNVWNVGSNIGIFGIDVNPVTQEEQWDLHYFNDEYGSYYKLKHSHDATHWITLQGAPNFNPTVLQAPKAIYDKEGFIRWNVTANADGSAPETNTPVAGAANVYYIVNVKRNRCLAIMYGLADPTADSVLPSDLQKSVQSMPKDVSGNFPSACRVEFLDAAGAKPAAGNGFWL